MLRKLAAGLLATALIAGPAFAQSSGNAGSAPPAATAIQAPAASTSQPAAKPAVKPIKSAKLVKHARKHVARHKVGKSKTVRNAKLTKTHRRHIAAHVTKPVKTGKDSTPTHS
jgi:hypothetical protein